MTSGLAITVVAENMAPPGWRILTEEDCFPKLSKADLVFLKGRTQFPAAAECPYNYLKLAVSATELLPTITTRAITDCMLTLPTGYSYNDMNVR